MGCRAAGRPVASPKMAAILAAMFDFYQKLEVMTNGGNSQF